MSMKFDFRTKLLVIVLTMSLVAVLTSDILIYTLFGVLSVYLIIQGFGRQTIKYLIVCGIFIVLRLLSGGQGITILKPEMFLFMVLRSHNHHQNTQHHEQEHFRHKNGNALSS